MPKIENKNSKNLSATRTVLLNLLSQKQSDSTCLMMFLKYMFLALLWQLKKLIQTNYYLLS